MATGEDSGDDSGDEGNRRQDLDDEDDDAGARDSEVMIRCHAFYVYL